MTHETEVDPSTGKTFGDVVPTRSTATSKIEAQVHNFLRDAGYPVSRGRVGVLVHHPDARWTFLTLTPDIVLEPWRLAVEVDPSAPAASGRYTTHHGETAKDRLRNDLLGAVGWSVLRLRLGTKEGDAIGDRDVVVESGSFTKQAQAALVAALEDVESDSPAQVRFVPKGATPRAAIRRSHVVNIGEFKYSDDGHIFSWYANLDEPEKITLRLCVGGRYLYSHHPHEPRFIAEIGLHEVSREEWKGRLSVFLQSNPPVETTKWPWGDDIVIGPHGSAATQELIERCAHSENSIHRLGFSFNISGDDISDWTPTSVSDSAGVVIATLHPGAVALGYRFALVTTKPGFRGRYTEVAISRK